MAVLGALRRAGGALRANPVLFLATGVLGVLQLPQLVAQTLNPAVATAVSMVTSLGFVVVMPFIQGGLIAMADEALDGRTTLGTFTRAGRANYVQLLIGYALVLGVNLALMLVLGVVGVVAGVGLLVLIPRPDEAGVLILLLVGLVLLVLVLVYLTIAFFIQFYGQAIVIDDHEAIAGFRRSVALVRSTLLATTGYSVIVGLVGGAFGLLVGILSILLSAGTGRGPTLVALSPAGEVAVVVGFAALSAIVAAFLLTYSVSYYRTVSVA